MADVAQKCRSGFAQHEGRVVITHCPANPLRGDVSNSFQTLSYTPEKITDVAVVEAKYQDRFDDYNYYSA